MRELLVSDYDGTFYRSDEEIEQNIKYVERFRKKGNLFVIATGRSYLDYMEKEKKYAIKCDYVILNSGATILKDDKIVCAPYLTNEVPENKLKKFKKAMGKIDDDILCQISEVMYDPNDIDADRYYLYMNDGNSVYLTVNKFSKINKYNTILENVGKQNGTLYLDYGDYFEVK